MGNWEVLEQLLDSGTQDMEEVNEVRFITVSSIDTVQVLSNPA